MTHTARSHDPGPDNYRDWYKVYSDEVLAYAGECGLSVLPADESARSLKAYYHNWHSPQKAAEDWVDYVIASGGG